MDCLHRVLKALLVLILSFYKDQRFSEVLIWFAISPQYQKDRTIEDKTCQRERDICTSGFPVGVWPKWSNINKYTFWSITISPKWLCSEILPMNSYNLFEFSQAVQTFFTATGQSVRLPTGTIVFNCIKGSKAKLDIEEGEYNLQNILTGVAWDLGVHTLSGFESAWQMEEIW